MPMQSLNLRHMVLGLLLVLPIITLTGCEQDTSDHSAPSDSSDNDWVADELLKQVQALREENAEIREQLGVITKKLEKLEEEGVRVAGQRKRRPSAPKSVRFDADRALGDESAPVAIVEFTDFQCPFCERHHQQVYPAIKEKMIETGKVRYVSMDYPLPFHGQAEGAAIAANCAGEQGRYWPMHHALFEGQKNLGEDLYLAQAKEFGIDIERFRTCLDDDAQRKAVNASVVYGQKVGVTGTPKFFVGRIKGDRIVDVSGISGAQQYGVFEAAVDRLLN